METLLAPLMCLDGISRGYIEFGSVLGSASDKGIVLWPVGRQLDDAFDDKFWRRFRIFFLLDSLRRRTRIQSAVGKVPKEVRRMIGRVGGEWLVCFLPIGDSTYMGTLTNLVKLVQETGHVCVITNDLLWR